MIFIYSAINLAAALLFIYAYRIGLAKGAIKSPDRNKTSARTAAVLAGLARRGFGSGSELAFYSVFPMAGAALAAYEIFSGRFARGMVVLLVPVFVMLMLASARKRKDSGIFQKNAYKLYKYISNQVAAGVRPGDAIRTMYEVVEERNLRKILTDACAKYSVSMDTGILAGEILARIDTPEARSFAMSLRDGLFESRDEKLMERLEQLMFNRYFVHIQRMTDGVRTRCLVSVVMLCSIIVVMILVPTIMDVQNALNSIFS
ncbi:MAG: hypothetical protein JXB33_01120 [Clostridia bacterium]|nr:hypothetical protein [Clostridia bacterium]